MNALQDSVLAIIDNMEKTQIPMLKCSDEKIKFLIYFDSAMPSSNLKLSELRACIVYNRDFYPFTDAGNDAMRDTLNFGTLLVKKGSDKLIIEMPPNVVAEPFSLNGNLTVQMKDNGPQKKLFQMSFGNRTTVEFRPMEYNKGQKAADFLSDFVDYMRYLVARNSDKSITRPKERVSRLPLLYTQISQDLAEIKQIAIANARKNKKEDCSIM